MNMNEFSQIDRRTVLKTIGAGAVGGLVMTDPAAARGNVVSEVNSAGHYAYFPLGPANWGRQKHPYDVREGQSRWMAEPAAGGGMRCLVENIELSAIPNRNAGFDVHMGQLSELAAIAIESETVRTQAGSEALLFVGLYLNVDENGEFFVWSDQKGDREGFAGVGGDEEGLLAIPAGGTYTIDDKTTFDLLVRGGSTTFRALKAGKVSGIGSKTPAALYIGVVDKDEDGKEEAVIKGVNIQRS